MEIKDLIKRVGQKIDEGIEPDEINKEIEKFNISESEKKLLRQHTQDLHIKFLLEKNKHSENFTIYIIAWIFLIFGLIVTIGTYIMGYESYIIWYGAIIMGLYFIMRKHMGLSNVEDEKPKTKSIFKKGLFKKF